MEALRPQAEQRRLTLQGEVAGYIPEVIMDSSRMQRVLYNLVQNALRHTPPDGGVIISAMDGGEEVTISVADTGEGISPEDLPHVFERFFRVDKARSRATGGTGLGLAIVKHVAANHNGSIRLWSQQGTGSTFTLSIPAYPETDDESDDLNDRSATQ